MPLHDYQQAGHEKAVAVLRSGGKRLFTAPTGSGKSYVIAANHESEYSGGLITVVPSIEIGLGIYQRFENREPDIRTWPEARQQKELEDSSLWTIQRLYNELMAGRLAPPKYLQFDECFVAGTLVAGKPIEEYRAGDCAETFSGFRRVLRTFKQPAPRRLYAVVAGGQRVVTTANHPFLTAEGWKNAAELTTDDRIVRRARLGFHDDAGPASQLQKDRFGLLFQAACFDSEQPPGYVRYEREAGGRDRWLVALHTAGQGPVVAFTRVDSVTLHEQGGEGEYDRVRGDGFVYNLQIENDPTYFANGLGVHNCHHSTAATWESVHALCNDCPAVGYTATGFRGTPDETARLRAKWGEPEPLLTLQQAVDRGFVSRPDFLVWPLLNDDTIRVSAGEFETKAAESALEKVAPALCDRIRDELCERGRPKRPTMVTAPGVGSARNLTGLLRERGIFAYCVTGSDCDTAFDHIKTRQDAFASVARAEAVLVQVNVVSEGVDLPIRVHVDTAPCMSPVRWMQRVGRGTRPVPTGEDRPVYICTNHNLTRHAYLWAGIIPSAQIRDAQRAWGPEYKPNRRQFVRALGLEGFGRFTASAVPLLDGSYLGLYALQTGNGTHQYAVLLHPCSPDPLFFERSNPYTGQMGARELPDGTTVQYKLKDWGKWKRIDTIPSADGYVSTKPGALTEGMLDWWRGRKGPGAEWCGLDPSFEPNAREFQVLPILLNTRTRFKLED